MPIQLLLLVAVPLALLGLTAPFGTTILGVVAIGQIKRSKGRLYGMPLAVFDALLFPLLLLDAIILVAVAAVTMTALVLSLGTNEPVSKLWEVLPAALDPGDRSAAQRGGRLPHRSCRVAECHGLPGAAEAPRCHSSAAVNGSNPVLG